LRRERAVPFFRLFSGRSERDKEEIARVAASTAVRDVVGLLRFFPPESHRLGEAASAAAEQLLRRTEPAEMLAFDQWSRGGWLPKGPPAPKWAAVRLGCAEWARRHPAVVVLASMHANGFVREQAVRLLDQLNDGFELPVLLVRTNDWNGVVQAAALAVVARRVRVDYGAHWIRCIALVDRLRGLRRRGTDLARLLRRIDALLSDPALRSRLATAFATGDHATRRAAQRIFLSLPIDEAAPHLLLATNDGDARIATECARAICARATAGDDVIEQLVTHRLPGVRVMALQTLARLAPERARPRFELALLDGGRSVRELARYELSRATTRDFAAYYREAIQERSGAERMAALEGLAECGTIDDVPILEQHVRDSSARVRVAAVCGLGRIDPSSHLDVLRAALDDPSPRVRRGVRPLARLHLGRASVRRNSG